MSLVYRTIWAKSLEDFGSKLDKLEPNVKARIEVTAVLPDLSFPGGVKALMCLEQVDWHRFLDYYPKTKILEG